MASGFLKSRFAMIGNPQDWVHSVLAVYQVPSGYEHSARQSQLVLAAAPGFQGQEGVYLWFRLMVPPQGFCEIAVEPQ